MSKVFINEETLIGIGNAIREKGGTIDLIATTDMANAIINLPSGGEELPEEAFLITGDCSYRFAQSGWNWLLDMYGNRITTQNIENTNRMFYNNTTLKKVPFVFNFNQSKLSDMSNMFYHCDKLESIKDMNIYSSKYVDMNSFFSNCRQLKTLPYLYGAYPGGMSSLVDYCQLLREIPEDYFDTWNFSRINSYNYASLASMFRGCWSLRKIPSKLFNYVKGHISTSASYSLYYTGFENCYVLDELVDLPVFTPNMTSNIFYDAFRNTHRLKRLVFQKNEDGTVKTANWKNQTIDLTYSVGFRGLNASTPLEDWPLTTVTNASDVFVKYNSGITIDKAIYNAETYSLLKDDPDAYCLGNSAPSTLDYGYSRYNHDSAVETINSLPDTSAFGTNTIKFHGNVGGKTDGGAINAMTEEEIAVATAKGWTVTFV